MYLNTRRDGDTVEAELAGTWRGSDLPAIDAELEGDVARRCRYAADHVPEGLELDLAGAWRLREWMKAAEAAGLAVELVGDVPGQLALIDSTLEGKRTTPRSSSESEFQPVSRLGRLVWRRWESVQGGARFPRPHHHDLAARQHQLAAHAADLHRAPSL